MPPAKLVPSHLPPVPTECGTGHVDLVMVIDGSKSVRPQNFELVKQFVNRIVDLLEVSPHGTRVGLVQYSSRVRTEFPLNKYHSADEIKKAVMEVEYMEKGTMTGLALKHMVEHSFSELEGARPLSHNVPRIGLVFTDGRSQDDISEWARRAKESGAGELGNPKLQCFGHPRMVPQDGWLWGRLQHPALGCCIARVRRGRCASAVVAGCCEQHPSCSSLHHGGGAALVSVLPKFLLWFWEAPGKSCILDCPGEILQPWLCSLWAWGCLVRGGWHSAQGPCLLCRDCHVRRGRWQGCGGRAESNCLRAGGAALLLLGRLYHYDPPRGELQAEHLPRWVTSALTEPGAQP